MNDKDKAKQVSLFLLDSEIKQLKTVALYHNTSPSSIVSRALADYYARLGLEVDLEALIVR